MPTTKPMQESIRRLKSFLGIRRNNLILRSFKNITITIDNEAIGLFAQLTWCAYIFQFAKEHNKAIKVRLISKNYCPTPSCVDWFSYYFDGAGTSKSNPKKSYAHISVRHMEDLGPGVTPNGRTIEKTQRAFFAEADLKTEIKDEIATFVRKNFSNEPVLGIHFRGTDKTIEAPRVPYENVLAEINKKIRDENYNTIFISTDEVAFIEYVQSEIKDKNIIFRNDSKRSTDDTPVHMGLQSGTDTARDAIVNCFLLAHCDTIIRTSSFLSAWSVIVNPSLKVLTLNTPFQNALWFPEREILERYEVKSGTDTVSA